MTGRANDAIGMMREILAAHPRDVVLIQRLAEKQQQRAQHAEQQRGLDRVRHEGILALFDETLKAGRRFHARLAIISTMSLIALPFVLLVPLVVVVEDQADDVIEALDESIWRGRIDDPRRPAYSRSVSRNR